MKKITELSPTTLRTIRERINKQLAPLATELGISLDAGTASYDLNGQIATFKLGVGVVREDGTVANQFTVDWERFHSIYKLEADDLGKVFWVMGTEYRILGLNAKSRTNPVIAKSLANDKTYKFSAGTVHGGLKMQRILEAQEAPSKAKRRGR